MGIFSNIEELELAEAYATDNSGIDSEETLSEHFDGMIGECGLEVAETMRRDRPALAEAFNNYTDSLCKDGDLHDSQYNTYEYVGKFAEYH